MVEISGEAFIHIVQTQIRPGQPQRYWRFQLEPNIELAEIMQRD